MSKYLDRAKKVRAIVTPHYNCAQSVIISFAPEAGITDEMAMNIGVNFGGGMKMASVCGALTGALMTLGLFGIDDVAILQEIYRGMRERHEGYMDCKDLLRINHEKGQEKKPHCDAMVYEMVEVVENILRREGKIE